ncbi:MAG TPA: hypothetical protein VGO93_17130 [Candidatus Xenobia bacterium]
MTAVAVWTQKPTADELLQERWDRGWRPQPSLLKSGPQILGHAACRVGEDTAEK